MNSCSGYTYRSSLMDSIAQREHSVFETSQPGFESWRLKLTTGKNDCTIKPNISMRLNPALGYKPPSFDLSSPFIQSKVSQTTQLLSTPFLHTVICEINSINFKSSTFNLLFRLKVRPEHISKTSLTNKTPKIPHQSTDVEFRLLK